MRRLLLATSSLDAGGAERWVLNTLDSNAKPEDLEVDYFFFEGVEDDALLEGYRRITRRIAFGECSGLELKKLHAISASLKKFIEENGPYDAIHLNGTKILYQAAVMRASEKAGIPVRIVHCHTTLTSNLKGIKAFARDLARRKTVRCATVVGACSSVAAGVCYGNGILENPKYHLFKNGVDLMKFKFDVVRRRAARESLGVEGKTVLLNVGNLESRKNQGFLLDTMSEYLKINPKAHLVLVGNGPDREILESKMISLGLAGSVSMVAQSESPEDYYCAADAFLLPSLSEGLPFVILEAQVCGLPCLVSTAVPFEAKMTELVEFLPLTAGATAWAEAVKVGASRKRDDYFDIVRREGYDLHDSSRDFFTICLGAY